MLEHRRSPEELPDLVEGLSGAIAWVFGRFQIPQADAEDLLQEVLLRYLQRHREIVSPEAWLIGALRKQCLMYWRTRRRALLQAVDAGLLQELAGTEPARQEGEDLSRDLSRVIGGMSERCRSLLRLRYGLGCESGEVAERMGYSPTGIRKITLRCLSALTNRMAAAGFEGAVP